LADIVLPTLVTTGWMKSAVLGETMDTNDRADGTMSMEMPQLKRVYDGPTLA
jgi:hypothetical protein